MEGILSAEEIRRPAAPAKDPSQEVGRKALESVGTSPSSKAEHPAGPLHIQPGQAELLVNLYSNTGTTAVPYGW